MKSFDLDEYEDTTATATTEEPVFDEDELAGEFVSDIRVLVAHYIDRFFAKFPVAGTSPDTLHAPNHLSLCMNTSVCSGVDQLYEAVARAGISNTERKGHLAEDVEYVIRMYRECALLGIPKQYATGILIMYLRLSKGQRLAA